MSNNLQWSVTLNASDFLQTIQKLTQSLDQFRTHLAQAFNIPIDTGGASKLVDAYGRSFAGLTQQAEVVGKSIAQSISQPVSAAIDSSKQKTKGLTGELKKAADEFNKLVQDSKGKTFIDARKEYRDSVRSADALSEKGLDQRLTRIQSVWDKFRARIDALPKQARDRISKSIDLYAPDPLGNIGPNLGVVASNFKTRKGEIVPGVDPVKAGALDRMLKIAEGRTREQKKFVELREKELALGERVHAREVRSFELSRREAMAQESRFRSRMKSGLYKAEKDMGLERDSLVGRWNEVAAPRLSEYDEKTGRYRIDKELQDRYIEVQRQLIEERKKQLSLEKKKHDTSLREHNSQQDAERAHRAWYNAITDRIRNSKRLSDQEKARLMLEAGEVDRFVKRRSVPGGPRGTSERWYTDREQMGRVSGDLRALSNQYRDDARDINQIDKRKQSLRELLALLRQVNDERRKYGLSDISRGQFIERTRDADGTLGYRRNVETRTQNRRELSSAQAQYKDLQDRARDILRSHAGMAQQQLESITRLAKWVLMYRFIHEAVVGIQRAIGDLFRSGIEYTKALELQRLGLQGILAENYQVVDSQGKQLVGLAALNQLQGESVQQWRQLQQASFAVVGTTEDLMMLYNSILPFASRMGKETAQVQEMVKATAVAASLMDISFQDARSAIVSLLQGRLLQRNRLVAALGFTKSDLNNMKEAGTLFDGVKAKLDSFSLMADKASMTTGALFETFKDIKGIIGSNFAAPLLDIFKTSMRGADGQGGLMGLIFQGNTGKIRRDTEAYFSYVRSSFAQALSPMTAMGDALSKMSTIDMMRLTSGLRDVMKGFVQLVAWIGKGLMAFTDFVAANKTMIKWVLELSVALAGLNVINSVGRWVRSLLVVYEAWRAKQLQLVAAQEAAAKRAVGFGAAMGVVTKSTEKNAKSVTMLSYAWGGFKNILASFGSGLVIGALAVFFGFILKKLSEVLERSRAARNAMVQLAQGKTMEVVETVGPMLKSDAIEDRTKAIEHLGTATENAVKAFGKLRENTSHSLLGEVAEDGANVVGVFDKLQRRQSELSEELGKQKDPTSEQAKNIAQELSGVTKAKDAIRSTLADVRNMTEISLPVIKEQGDYFAEVAKKEEVATKIRAHAASGTLPVDQPVISTGGLTAAPIGSTWKSDKSVKQAAGILTGGPVLSKTEARLKQIQSWADTVETQLDAIDRSQLTPILRSDEDDEDGKKKKQITLRQFETDVDEQMAIDDRTHQAKLKRAKLFADYKLRLESDVEKEIEQLELEHYQNRLRMLSQWQRDLTENVDYNLGKMATPGADIAQLKDLLSYEMRSGEQDTERLVSMLKKGVDPDRVRNVWSQYQNRNDQLSVKGRDAQDALDEIQAKIEVRTQALPSSLRRAADEVNREVAQGAADVFGNVIDATLEQAELQIANKVEAWKKESFPQGWIDEQVAKLRAAAVVEGDQKQRARDVALIRDQIERVQRAQNLANEAFANGDMSIGQYVKSVTASREELIDSYNRLIAKIYEEMRAAKDAGQVSPEAMRKWQEEIDEANARLRELLSLQIRINQLIKSFSSALGELGDLFGMFGKENPFARMLDGLSNGIDRVSKFRQEVVGLIANFAQMRQKTPAYLIQGQGTSGKTQISSGVSASQNAMHTAATAGFGLSLLPAKNLGGMATAPDIAANATKGVETASKGMMGKIMGNLPVIGMAAGAVIGIASALYAKAVEKAKTKMKESIDAVSKAMKDGTLTIGEGVAKLESERARMVKQYSKSKAGRKALKEMLPDIDNQIDDLKSRIKDMRKTFEENLKVLRLGTGPFADFGKQLFDLEKSTREYLDTFNAHAAEGTEEWKAYQQAVKNVSETFDITMRGIKQSLEENMLGFEGEALSSQEKVYSLMEEQQGLYEQLANSGEKRNDLLQKEVDLRKKIAELMREMAESEAEILRRGVLEAQLTVAEQKAIEIAEIRKKTADELAELSEEQGDIDKERDQLKIDEDRIRKNLRLNEIRLRGAREVAKIEAGVFGMASDEFALAERRADLEVRTAQLQVDKWSQTKALIDSIYETANGVEFRPPDGFPKIHVEIGSIVIDNSLTQSTSVTNDGGPGNDTWPERGPEREPWVKKWGDPSILDESRRYGFTTE